MKTTLKEKAFNIYNARLGKLVLFSVCYAAATQICDGAHPYLFAIATDGDLSLAVRVAE